MKINEVTQRADEISPGYNMTPAEKALADIGRLLMQAGENMPMGKGVSDEDITLSMDAGQLGSDMVHGYIKNTKDIAAAVNKSRSDSERLMGMVKDAIADFKAGKKANITGDDVPDDDDQDDFGRDDDDKIARDADRFSKGM